MANLLSVYNLYVYDDGSVVLRPISNSSRINTDGASSSIRQIVRTLELVAEGPYNKGVRRRVSQGITKTARIEGINESSVHSKMTRKLDLSMKEFKDLVENYFAGLSTELEDVLLDACVDRSKTEDESALNQLFKHINSKRPKATAPLL